MTSLMRWNPFDDLASRWPRSIFGRDIFSSLRPDGTVEVEWSPRCDVSETDDEIIVHAELPGVDPKDMDVTIADGMLRIRGEKRTQREADEQGRKYTERFFGSFERAIALPANVDPTGVEAKLAAGVLEVHVPRTRPVETEARKIEIKVS